MLTSRSGVAVVRAKRAGCCCDFSGNGVVDRMPEPEKDVLKYWKDTLRLFIGMIDCLLHL